jgi:hypothetical protein
MGAKGDIAYTLAVGQLPTQKRTLANYRFFSKFQFDRAMPLLAATPST